jgi:hypothetical protein
MWPDERATYDAIRRQARRLRDLHWEALARTPLNAAEKAAIVECVAELVFQTPSEDGNAGQWIEWEAQLLQREP